MAAKTAATGVNKLGPGESLLAFVIYPLFWQGCAEGATLWINRQESRASVFFPPLRQELSDSLVPGDREVNNPVSSRGTGGTGPRMKT
jgi:hypothetical protein